MQQKRIQLKIRDRRIIYVFKLYLRDTFKFFVSIAV
jgi:hypothetical protein